MKLYIKLFLVILTISFFSSCVDDINYSEPTSNIKTYELVANKTIENITLPSSIETPYADDDIIEGYVTSSDETGNFFNTITFQSAQNSSNSITGFSVSVELESFDKGFKPGRKVYIKLKGLHIALVDGSKKIGTLYDNNGVNEIGRISKYDWQNHLFPSSTIVDESALVRTVTLQEASSDIRLNTLLEISNVQFADGSLEKNLYEANNDVGGATNHLIVAATGGNVKYLRTSSYSLLKGKKVPFGRGTIRGIMTKYSDDYQFVIRYYNDIKLTERRTYNFRSSFTENFSTFGAPTGNYNELRSIFAFKDYVNFATEGTKNWFIRDNSFLEMSAFSGNVEKNKCFFMVPVNMTDASTFSFKFKFQFYSSGGNAFKIYRTSNYVYGMKFSDVTLVDISSSFLLPSANTDSFASAGVYNIPESVTGNDFFVFVYTGTNITTGPPVTTTVQIDDILVN